MQCSYSWKLVEDFNKHRHLFTDCTLHYIIVVYSCICGKESIIVSNKEVDHQYSCPRCANSDFLDANRAVASTSFFLHQFKRSHWKRGLYGEAEEILTYDFNFEIYEAELTKETLQVHYGFYVPVGINFLEKKVRYGFHAVCTYGLGITEGIIETYILPYDEALFKKLKTVLEKKLLKHRSFFNIPTEYTQKPTVEIARFFSSYPHIKEFAWYYWNDITPFYEEGITIHAALHKVANNITAKSIKKAIYTNYIKQIEDEKRYFHQLDHSMCSTINDVNILRNVLKITNDFPYSKYSEYDIKKIPEFIEFLLSRMSSKSLLAFLKNFIQEDEITIIDMLNEFQYCKDKKILDNIENLGTTLLKMHDQFSYEARCDRDKASITSFSYLLEIKKHQMRIDGYTVLLPKLETELFQWADTLHNCLSSYSSRILCEASTIYGFLKNDTIDFAVEYDTASGVRQALGKYNRQLNEEQEGALKKWLRKVKELKQMQKDSKMKLQNDRCGAISVNI